MKTRLLLGAATAALLALALAGCGGGGNSSSAASANCTPVHKDLKTVKSGTLLVSAYVSPPYTKLDRAGADLGGIDGLVVNDIAKMECLKVQASSVTGAAFTEGVKAGRSDIVVGGVYSTPDRAKDFTLSDPMYRDGLAFLTKGSESSISDVMGKKVGVIQGYLWTDDLQKALGQSNVTIFQDADSMVSDLNVGRIDVAVLTTAEAGYRAGQSSGLKVNKVQPDSRVAASKGDSDVVVMMNKNSTELAAAINADIHTLLQDGKIASILKDNGIAASQAGAASS
ncbi:substrate-binding periplasmic protein [Micromonospora sp. NPDC005161]